jgi:hypothetical protein
VFPSLVSYRMERSARRQAQLLEVLLISLSLTRATVIRRAEFNKTRELAMSESVRAVIERRGLARTVMTTTGPRVCDLVFHRDGRPIREFRKAWERAAAGLCVTVKDAEGRESKRAIALFHDFRRSCVRNLENVGTPHKVAKSITGHITDSVYERYHIVKEEDQRAAPARVEAAFRRDPAQIAEIPAQRLASRKLAEGEGFEPPKAAFCRGFLRSTAR